jgi:dCMP deaminase
VGRFTLEQVRPTWDDYFLGIAIAVSKRADCRRRLVGAVLVDSDHKIISTGYNGVLAGMRGCLDGGCPRGLLSQDKVPAFSDYNNVDSPGYCISTHAEMNAMLYAGQRVVGATMYITDPPCEGCRKIMHNAGIRKAVTSSGTWGFIQPKAD